MIYVKLFTREELIDKILQEEDLLPGDKVSLAKLNNISEKYGISPYVLATNLFEGSQHNYANLNSKNTTNVVILKRRLPEIIAKVG